jgi:hypothetical protein
MYQPLSGKPWTRVKRPLHIDRVILQLLRRAGPKELFASKGFRTLDLIELPQRPRPLPLEPTLWDPQFNFLIKVEIVKDHSVTSKVNNKT